MVVKGNIKLGLDSLIDFTVALFELIGGESFGSGIV